MKYDTVLLNPDYHFKNDIDRIVLYSGKQVNNYSSPEWISYLHPIQAEILSAFCHRKSLSEQCQVMSDYFKVSKENIAKMIEPYIENETPIYTVYSGQKVLFPKNVLVDAAKVNKNIRYDDYHKADFYCKKVNLTPDRLHAAPMSMLFMLTNKCITNCKYCYADKKTKYDALSTTEILNIIEQAKKLKMTYIDVIGGEIFCKKDWNIIISKLVEKNLTPNYISTKVPLTENDIKKLSVTGYRNVIQISLDALDDNVLKKIIGVSNGYTDKIKDSIRLLSKYGFKVQIDTILTKYNTNKKCLSDLFEYIKSIKNLVYWEIRIPEYSIYSPKSFNQVQVSKDTIESIRAYVKSEIIDKAGFPVFFSDDVIHQNFRKGKSSDECFTGGSCGILQNRLFILPDGKVSVCEQLYWHPQFIIGDLRKQSISEIWNSPKALKLFELKRNLFRKESRCYNCKMLDLCNNRHRRCFVKVIKAYGSKNWDYPDPRCIYAPKINTGLIY